MKAMRRLTIVGRVLSVAAGLAWYSHYAPVWGGPAR